MQYKNVRAAANKGTTEQEVQLNKYHKGMPDPHHRMGNIIVIDTLTVTLIRIIIMFSKGDRQNCVLSKQKTLLRNFMFSSFSRTLNHQNQDDFWLDMRFTLTVLVYIGTDIYLISYGINDVHKTL